MSDQSVPEPTGHRPEDQAGHVDPVAPAPPPVQPAWQSPYGQDPTGSLHMGSLHMDSRFTGSRRTSRPGPAPAPTARRVASSRRRAARRSSSRTSCRPPTSRPGRRPSTTRGQPYWTPPPVAIAKPRSHRLLIGSLTAAAVTALAAGGIAVAVDRPDQGSSQQTALSTPNAPGAVRQGSTGQAPAFPFGSGSDRFGWLKRVRRFRRFRRFHQRTDHRPGHHRTAGRRRRHHHHPELRPGQGRRHRHRAELRTARS